MAETTVKATLSSLDADVYVVWLHKPHHLRTVRHHWTDPGSNMVAVWQHANGCWWRS